MWGDELMLDVGSAAAGELRQMRLTVIGIGYLGLTYAVCMAELGHEILAIDVDQDNHKQPRGEVPFFEPCLQLLLQKSLTERSGSASPAPTEKSRSLGTSTSCVSEHQRRWMAPPTCNTCTPSRIHLPRT